MLQIKLKNAYVYGFYAAGVLLYALGGGIARYLGYTISWPTYFWGQIWVTSLQIGIVYLNAVDGMATEDIRQKKNGILGSATGFAMTAVTSVILFQEIGFSPGFLLIMTLSLFGVLLVFSPYTKTHTFGYREVLEGLFLANLIPSLGFILQRGDLHRLLVMSTFSLTFLYISMRIVSEFPAYTQRLEFVTLLQRIGWERGMWMHNLLILSAFLFWALAVVLGFPLAIAIPVFLVLPFAAYEVYLMVRIADGEKPNWRLMTGLGVGVFGACAYLLAYAFWTR